MKANKAIDTDRVVDFSFRFVGLCTQHCFGAPTIVNVAINVQSRREWQAMKLVKRHWVEFLSVVVGGGPGESELPKIVVSVGDQFVWLCQRSCLYQDKKETEE